MIKPFKSNITIPKERFNLMDFFPILKEKNSKSERLFHKYVPVEVFRGKMKSAIMDALQYAYPISVDWDLDNGPMYMDNSDDHNFFDIKKKGYGEGLKEGDSYINTKDGVVTSRNRNGMLERKRHLLASFRNILIDNIKSTKWDMVYSDKNKSVDSYSSEEIRKTANSYRNAVLLKIATSAVGYGIGKALERNSIAKIDIKSNNKGVMSMLQKKGLLSDNINFIDLGLDFASDKVTPKGVVQVGVIDNQWVRSCYNNVKEFTMDQIRKVRGGNQVAGYVDRKISDTIDSTLENKELLLGAMSPHYSIASTVVNVGLNADLYYRYDKVAKKAEQGEEESDEAWRKTWCDYIQRDIEKMSGNDFYNVCNLLNISGCDWLKD